MSKIKARLKARSVRRSFKASAEALQLQIDEMGKVLRQVELDMNIMISILDKKRCRLPGMKLFKKGQYDDMHQGRQEEIKMDIMFKNQKTGKTYNGAKLRRQRKR